MQHVQAPRGSIDLDPLLHTPLSQASSATLVYVRDAMNEFPSVDAAEGKVLKEIRHELGKIDQGEWEMMANALDRKKLSYTMKVCEKFGDVTKLKTVEAMKALLSELKNFNEIKEKVIRDLKTSYIRFRNKVSTFATGSPKSMQLLANSLLDLTFDDFQILVGFDQARPLQVRVNSLNVGVGFIRYASVHPRWHADFKEQQIASCQRRIDSNLKDIQDDCEKYLGERWRAIWNHQALIENASGHVSQDHQDSGVPTTHSASLSRKPFSPIDRRRVNL